MPSIKKRPIYQPFLVDERVDHTLIDYTSLRNKIVSVGYQYQIDNLPIEEWSLNEFSDEELEQDNRIFIQQLRLIEEKMLFNGELSKTITELITSVVTG